MDSCSPSFLGTRLHTPHQGQGPTQGKKCPPEIGASTGRAPGQPQFYLLLNCELGTKK